MKMADEADKYGRGYIKIDLDAVVENVNYLRTFVGSGTGIFGVVKADAYGHGSVGVARKLEPFGFMYGFAVATPEEAFELREGGITKPILVLGFSFPYAYEIMARQEIRSTVYSLDAAGALQEAACKAGRPLRVHIKVDTGMNRIGITPDEHGLSFVKALKEQEGILIEGIYTHFARADEMDKSNAEAQLVTFLNFIHMIKERLALEIPIIHCANSAGILEMPRAGMSAVRAGIAMYGITPSGEMGKAVLPLRPALSLYSHIVRIKMIEPGQSVSYGGIFTAEKRTRVATIPVGYGDGYPRSLSGRGYVLIHGKKAPILGRICMDQFMVDVSSIPEVTVGDRVVLIGSDGRESIDAYRLGELSGRFHYELLCGLGLRLPRIYTQNVTAESMK